MNRPADPARTGGTGAATRPGETEASRRAGEENGPTGRVGPNAITRVAEALSGLRGEAETAIVFAAAGLAPHLADPPAAMVPEDDVARLHRALHDRLGPVEAARIAREAGRLTGDYLLAHRIPAPAQRLLRLLPRPLAARILVAAIARHAWTFAGSGRFSYGFAGGGLDLTLEGSPVCRDLRTEAPACDYLAATFERVFAAMLGPEVRVVETACAAAGAPACRFRVDWRGGVPVPFPAPAC